MSLQSKGENRVLVAAFLVLLFLAGLARCALSATPLTFREVDLTALEHHADRLLDLDRPLLRCGEVVHTQSGQMAIVWDYRFTKNQWLYVVRKAHYQKAKP